MNRQAKPATIVIIGVLQLVFGGLGILGDALNGVGLSMQGKGLFQFGTMPQGTGAQAEKQRKIQEMVERSTKELNPPKTFAVPMLIVDVLVSGIMIAGGIGLLRLQSWGRILCLLYAVLSILSKIVALVYSILVIMPKMPALAQEFNDLGQDGQIMRGALQIGLYFGIVWIVVTMLYPAIVFICMFRRPVIEALNQQEPSLVEEPPEEEVDPRWGR